MHPRLGTDINLPDGGTYDLLYTEFSGGFPQGKLTFDIQDSPRKITGVQKVAQLFLKVLFTSEGSDLLNPSLGTKFSYLAINSNRVTDTSELIDALVWEITKAEGLVKSLTAGSDAASTLASVSILALEVNEDGVHLALNMITEDGEEAYVAVPSPQTDLELSE